MVAPPVVPDLAPDAPIPLLVPAIPETFDQAAYLDANPDVRAAVAATPGATARAHFEAYGQREGRRQRVRPGAELAEARRRKLERLRPHLRDEMPHRLLPDGRPDYLTDELRAATGIADTENVSANGYDADILALIARHRDGLVLDCGAGRRDAYHRNVVNFEIVAYDTTDVLGVGEALPFRDASFDAVLSIAVLEHVRDPFRCAAEIVRVLKPGGELLCAVPFLQPLHGYPHHYFNATHQGLRRLFEDSLAIESVTVPDMSHPAFALRWILDVWASGLPAAEREAFLGQRVRDLLRGPPEAIAAQPFGALLPEATRFDIASGFLLKARRPDDAAPRVDAHPPRA